MKAIVLTILTLITSSALASERSIDAMIDYNNERVFAFNACVAGDNSRCECPTIKEKISDLKSSITSIDTYVGNAVRRCLRNAAALTLGADGPATRDVNGRAKAEQYCYANELNLTVAASEVYASKKFSLTEDLSRLEGIEQAVCSN